MRLSVSRLPRLPHFVASNVNVNANVNRTFRCFDMCVFAFVVLARASNCSSFCQVRLSVRRFGMNVQAFAIFPCASKCSSFWHVRLRVRGLARLPHFISSSINVNINTNRTFCRFGTFV